MDMICQCCRAPGSDVKLVPCGCTMHAKCTPLQLFARTNGLGSIEVHQPGQMACPFCGNQSRIQSVYIMPMTTELLDTASAEKGKLYNSNDKTAPEESRIESPYLLLTNSSSDNREYRTGRFPDEEMDLCDFLMQNFDKGFLPMSAGVRLNDFLCTLLLCKASRLTKKMKNAKLGSRTYELLSHDPTAEPLNFELFTKLQERFLNSVPSLSVRCELRFQMDKVWRSNLSALCVQLGCKLLDASDWIANLEDMERRGAQAEENIRKARRRRMGLALKTDVRAPAGVYFSGVPVQPPSAVAPASETQSLKRSGDSFVSNVTATSSESMQTHHIHTMLDIGDSKPSEVPSDTMEDFASFFEDLIESKPTSSGSLSMGSQIRGSSGSFLEEVAAYLEQKDLPFQHADIWVPSYHPNSQKRPQDLRLFHSGHATRSDVDPIIASQLFEYGEYSTKFSFATGVGLPGRVYKSGDSSWECRIDLADPKIFERAGGAGVYGVKTGVGIALSSSLVGRLVLCLYSLEDLVKDGVLIKQLERDLAAFCPKPTWKLVVEMDSDSMSSKSASSVPEALSPVLNFGERTRSDSMSVNSALTNHSQSRPTDPRELEYTIAKLLTDFLPGASLPGPMTDTDDGLLPFYMSLRLSLLRDPDKRSSDENSKLEVIRKSYEGFASSQSRSKRHIADMVVRDWRFLKTNMDEKTSMVGQHQSMIMNEPRVNTFAPSGAPARVPFALGDPIGPNKKRRVFTPGEINIVDDTSS